MQAFEQRGDLAGQHAGHQPFTALVADLVQRVDRHRHRHTVLRVTRLMQVGHGAIHPAQAQHFGECAAGDAGGLMAHQLIPGELQHLGVGAALELDPALQRGTRMHIGRQQLVVKSVDQLVVHQHVLASAFVLQLLHLGQQLAVVGDERQVAVPVPFHQRAADEDFACAAWVHIAEVHPPVVVDDDAVQRGTLQGHHFGRFFLPVRLQQLCLQQVPGHTRYPLRLDAGQATAIQLGGIHQFGTDQPAARLFAQVCTGVAPELDATGAQIPILVIALAADVAQQAGQHGQVDLLVGGGTAVQAPALLSHHGVQLAVDVAPFPHSARVDKAVTQALLLLAVAELVTVDAGVASADCRG